MDLLVCDWQLTIFSNNLIIQWGQNQAGQTILPISYNSFYSVLTVGLGDNGYQNTTEHIARKNLSDFSIVRNAWNSWIDEPCCWIAIGY